jgi:hypothetical protein
VEDFALSVNLMLACAMRIVEGGPVDCLQAIAEAYGTGATTLSSCRQNGESEIRQVGGSNPVYKVLTAMNESRLWTAEPNTAYLQWQTTEAAGADRRRFSKRSIVQHKAMFDRFLRHLLSCGVALPTFGSEHLESFFGDVDNRCAPGTTIACAT